MIMEELKCISQLTKNSCITYIKNDEINFYEYLSVHPNNGNYYLFIDKWSQEVIRIYVKNLLNGDYYVGEYDPIFCESKLMEYYKRRIKNSEHRIEELRREL